MNEKRRLDAAIHTAKPLQQLRPSAPLHQRRVSAAGFRAGATTPEYVASRPGKIKIAPRLRWHEGSTGAPPLMQP
jgi:2-methylisocitrate lyase-like PEP mutase family enzyme